MTDTTSRGRRLAITTVAVTALMASGLLGLIVPPARVAATTAPAARAVIIVGPTEGQTPGYIQSAQSVAADAAGHGLDVVRLYSSTPENTAFRPGTDGILAATWQNVVAQVNAGSGHPAATLLVYMGHGNGYPNPYNTSLMTDRNNGFVLDPSSGTPCAIGSGKAYCGEGPIAASLHLNTNAVVLLEHLCYASGDNESNDPSVPSQATAKTRADGYAAGFIKAGAAAVFAYGVQDVGQVIDTIYDTDETLEQVFEDTGFYGDADFTFASVRSPGNTVHMDPHASKDGADPYYRSVVGNLALTTDQVVSGAPDPDRWAGADRYATSAAISDHSFTTPPTPLVFLASGANFPDALAGAAAAALKDAPLVLTSPATLPATTQAELKRLRPGHIVILGGTSSVSAAVQGQLTAYTAKANITRLAGADRYATAATISTTYFKPGVSALYVAQGLNFPDALVGAAAAGHAGAPVLLVAPDAIPAATRAALIALAPKSIKVLGSSGAISDAVFAGLQKLTKGSVKRLGGSDRYGTAVAISQDAYPGTPHVATLYVASGANFPDALSGAALGGALMLVPAGTVPPAVLTEIRRLDPGRVVFLGGPTSVSYSTELVIHQAVPDAT